MKIAIIDYDAGNLANVYHALIRQGADCLVTRDRKTIHGADALILPGVGAMKNAMDNLARYDLVQLIRDEVGSGKKLAGVCLGMQALFEASEEDGETPCLGFIPGRVVKLDVQGQGLKVPHMGWNELEFRKEHWIAQGLGAHPYVYFVHSYGKTPADTPDIIAVAEYGGPVPAIVGKENVIGLQFHPEKSGRVGEQLWRNILEWFGK